jgi:hypothetical protein
LSLTYEFGRADDSPQPANRVCATPRVFSIAAPLVLEWAAYSSKPNLALFMP